MIVDEPDPRLPLVDLALETRQLAEDMAKVYNAPVEEVVRTLRQAIHSFDIDRFWEGWALSIAKYALWLIYRDAWLLTR